MLPGSILISGDAIPVATTVPAFVTGDAQRVNNELLTAPNFAGDLLSHKHDALSEMLPQN
jgi:hypothetical protein